MRRREAKEGTVTRAVWSPLKYASLRLNCRRTCTQCTTFFGTTGALGETRGEGSRAPKRQSLQLWFSFATRAVGLKQTRLLEWCQRRRENNIRLTRVPSMELKRWDRLHIRTAFVVALGRPPHRLPVRAGPRPDASVGHRGVLEGEPQPEAGLARRGEEERRVLVARHLNHR